MTGGLLGEGLRVMREVKYMKHLYLLHPREVHRLWEDSFKGPRVTGNRQESWSLKVKSTTARSSHLQPSVGERGPVAGLQWNGEKQRA